MNRLHFGGSDVLSSVINDFGSLSTRVNSSVLPNSFMSDSYKNSLHNYISNYCSSENNRNLKKDIQHSQTHSVPPKHSTLKDSQVSEIAAKRFYDADDSYIIIHVCDEAKKLNKNFNCPRDLLVKEMKYFAQYLIFDHQQLEEVDISVHCDVEIFDWLMRYVKRSTNLIDQSEVPKLESNNVVSILISSDFLKMDSLVEECVAFFHKNMSAVLSTPCNMNCINKQLCARIASKFDHNELEQVRDRKDKFKSKLFKHLIERLFKQPEEEPVLMRCGKCNRVMTREQRRKLKCCGENMRVDAKGRIVYKHQADRSWDINSWLLSLHEQLKSWSLVYWRIWGTVNHLYCSVCKSHFQLLDYSSCRYHREKAQIEKGQAVGVYPCCSQAVLRFDPTEIQTGCCTKDHKVLVSSDSEQQIFDDLLKNVDLVKTDFDENFDLDSDCINVFAPEEKMCLVDNVNSPVATKKPVTKKPPPKVPVNKLVLDSEEEDDTDSEEEAPIPKKIYPPPKQDPSKSQKRRSKRSKDTSVFGEFPSKHRWDSNLRNRQNQDLQREDDRRRMQLMSNRLSRENMKRTDQKEVHGGMFVKLEIDFLNTIKAQQLHEKKKNREADLKEAKSKYNRAK